MLSDDKKRALYDQYGEAGVKSTVGGPSNAYTVLDTIVLLFSIFILQIVTLEGGIHLKHWQVSMSLTPLGDMQYAFVRFIMGQAAWLPFGHFPFRISG